MDEDEKQRGGRTRQLSESCDGGDTKRTRSSDEATSKSTAPSASSVAHSPSSPTNEAFSVESPEPPSSSFVASSPPRFVNMDKLMETVREEAARMQLAHEIAVNPDFKLEPRNKVDEGAGTAYAAIHQSMMKAYWDIIQEDLKKEPPVLDMVFKLCGDIRQMLLDLLLPHQNSMRARIEELFDIDLIRQRCEQAKSVEPLRDYGPAVLDIMQRLCCPMRDEEIEALRKENDTVQLFQGIIRVMEEMKLDFANFLIKQIRPLVNEHIHNYEKEKIKELETAQRLMGVEDPLVNTKAWLQRAFNDLQSTDNQRPAGGATLLQGYMQLVFQSEYINEEWELPETLLLDQDRIVKLQHAYLTVTIASSVIIITQKYVPSALAASRDFKCRLKEASMAVLKDVQSTSETDLRDALLNLANKIVQDVQRETNGKALADGQEKLLHGQLTELASAEHPVRTVVFGRVIKFVSTMAKSGGKDVEVPPGLSALETELTKLAADFIQIISLNRATHSEKYDSILADIHDTKATRDN